ncbi:Bacterial regulatory protein, arsR family [anaerobic digester metagenome]|nr:ArsR family transcriptional regulator [Methanomassiliicoccales archaeon]
MHDLAEEVGNRRNVYEMVCRYPGTHLRELSRMLGLAHNLTEYHLHYLEKRSLVFSQQDGMFKRYYPRDPPGTEDRRDRFSDRDKPIVAMLRKPIPFRIIVLLAKDGELLHKDLVAGVKRSPPTVSHHLEKLVGMGIVAKGGQGGGYLLADPPRIERILLAFTPQPASLMDGFIGIWEDLSV